MKTGIAMSFGFKVKVRSNSHAIFEYLSDVSRRAIPDYSFHLASGPDEYVDWAIVITEISGQGRFLFDLSRKQVAIQYSPDKFWQNDLEILLLYLFSNLYLGRKIICAHSVGLQSPCGVGLMITGEMESGKSITGLQLLMHGYRFVGNDRLLIEEKDKEIVMIGGTLPIRLRQATIERYFPQVSTNEIDGIRWGKFQSFLPGYFGFQQAGPTTVKMFVRVKVSPIKNQDCTCYRLEDLDGPFAYVKVYHPLSFYCIGSHLVHLSTMNTYPSISDTSSDFFRLKIAERIITGASCYELHGNLEWVTRKIDSLVRGPANGNC